MIDRRKHGRDQHDAGDRGDEPAGAQHRRRDEDRPGQHRPGPCPPRCPCVSHLNMPVLKVGTNQRRILVQIITIDDEPIKGSSAHSLLADVEERGVQVLWR